jgi:hypothetical protein
LISASRRLCLSFNFSLNIFVKILAHLRYRQAGKDYTLIIPKGENFHFRK